jgi:hypothetical protein
MLSHNPIIRRNHKRFKLTDLGRIVQSSLSMSSNAGNGDDGGGKEED